MATRYEYEDGEDFSGSGYGKSNFTAATKGTTFADLNTYDLISSKYGQLQTFEAPLSNKGNATSQISSKTNTFAVSPQTAVRLVDNATGEVVFEGVGYDAAQKARDLAQGLSDTSGRKANWDIQAATPGMTNYATVAHEAPNKSTLGEIGNVLGTALPIAMIPLTMGASAPLAGLGTLGTIGLGAGVGGVSAGLKGQNILKGAVMGGATAAGGQLLGGPLKGVGLGADAATAVGTGLGATAGGLATGQSLTDALKGGVISGGMQYLGSKVLGPSPEEIEFQRNLSQNANNAVADAVTSGLDYMDASLIDAGYYPKSLPSSASSAAPSSFAVAPASTLSATAPSDYTVNAQTGAGASPINTAGLAVLGGGPTATTTGPDLTATAKTEPTTTEEPTSAFTVPVATTTGPDLTSTAKTEPTSPLAINTGAYTPPLENIDIKAIRDAAEAEEFPRLSVYTPPGENIDVSAKKDAIDLEDKPLAVNLDVASTLAGTGPKLTDKVVEPKSDLDKALAAAKAASLLIPLLGGGGKDTGAGTGTYNSGKAAFDPIFSAKLPTPGTAGAFTVGGLGGTAGGVDPLAARPTADWYRYGMGPAMDVPAGTDMSKATSPYAGYGPGTLGEETFKQVTGMSHGGPMGYSRGSTRESFAVEGPGTGRSDDIPAVLSDGEYVIDAETVALLGDGSSRAGAKKLDDLRIKVRKHKGKNLAQGKFSVNARNPEAYMLGGRI